VGSIEFIIYKTEDEKRSNPSTSGSIGRTHRLKAAPDQVNLRARRVAWDPSAYHGKRKR
jgi:hypothetical protein